MNNLIGAALCLCLLMLGGCMDGLGDVSSTDVVSDNNTSIPSTYSYHFTCPDTHQQVSIEIESGSCSSAYEFYAYTFSCNLVDNFDDAACRLQSCTGTNFACGAYAQP
jgi:hypothetical protein